MKSCHQRRFDGAVNLLLRCPMWTGRATTATNSLSERPDRCGMGAYRAAPGSPAAASVAVAKVINGVMYIGEWRAMPQDLRRPAAAPCMITSAWRGERHAVHPSALPQGPKAARASSPTCMHHRQSEFAIQPRLGCRQADRARSRSHVPARLAEARHRCRRRSGSRRLVRPSPGSTAAADWPRTGRTSTATRSPSSSSVHSTHAPPL